jgi:hypothetical protein
VNQPQKKARRPAAGTAAAALDAIQQAAAGWPEPPPGSGLRPTERRVWDAIMVARLPQQWAQVDLLHAANLARCLADINSNRAKLLKEGMVVKTPSGPKVNPRHALLETLNRRAIALTRVLQLHAVATAGPKREQAGSKGEAEAAAAALKQNRGAADVDQLLAQPRRLQ